MVKMISAAKAKDLLNGKAAPTEGATVHVGNKVGITRKKSGAVTRYYLHGTPAKVSKALATV